MSGNGDDEKPGADTAEPAGLEAAPETPADELTTLRREVADLRDQVLRKRAEFENFRRRTERDRAQARLDGVAAVLRGLIPTIDNLERALSAEAADNALKEGVELIRRELMALLEAHEVTVDDPVGQPFDPLRHQALAHEPAAGVPEDTVVEVFRKGYALKDRLLRPALVKVSAPAGDDSGAPPGEKVH